MRLLRLLSTLLLFLPGPRAAAAARSVVTVLSYHEIADEAEALSPAYAVTPTNFLRQMDWLRNHGYRFVGVDDVLASRDGRRPLPEKAILVTFDDAYRSIYVHAWPVLRMFRIPAVVNVVGNWLEAKDTIDFDGRARPRAALIDWKALREMVDSGLVEVGSHSWDLHRGILGNPQGNLEPAGTTRRWMPDQKQYESEEAYRRRVQADLERNSDLIRRRVGPRPARDRLAVRPLQRRDPGRRPRARDAGRAHARGRRATPATLRSSRCAACSWSGACRSRSSPASSRRASRISRIRTARR